MIIILWCGPCSVLGLAGVREITDIRSGDQDFLLGKFLPVAGTWSHPWTHILYFID